MKKYHKNIFYFLSGISSLTIAFLTMRGTIQKYIHFSGIPNEIAFCLFTTILGIGLIFSGIPTRHFRKLRNKLFPFTLEIEFKAYFQKRYHSSGISMRAWKKYTNNLNK
jgi:hypothetical protein